MIFILLSDCNWNVKLFYFISDYKNGNQEKPKQLFWEKRLEGLRACDVDGVEFEGMQLPKGLKPVGPNVTEETIIQSVATALHVSSNSVTGRHYSEITIITQYYLKDDCRTNRYKNFTRKKPRRFS